MLTKKIFSSLNILFFSILALLFVTTNEAKSSYFQIVGGTSFITGANNDYSQGWGGRTNATQQMSLVTTQPNLTLTFELVFREASGSNTFGYIINSIHQQLSYSLIPNNTIVPPSSTPSFTFLNQNAGLIDFYFINNTLSAVLSNGSVGLNVPPLNNFLSYFMTFSDPFSPNKSTIPSSSDTSDVVWIGFDDGGIMSVRYNDFDYDDLIIKITAKNLNAVNVSEPYLIFVVALVFLSALLLFPKTRKI